MAAAAVVAATPPKLLLHLEQLYRSLEASSSRSGVMVAIAIVATGTVIAYRHRTRGRRHRMRSTTLQSEPTLEILSGVFPADSELVFHRASCHCGRVRFVVHAPADLDAVDCSCSMHSKNGNNPHVVVPARCVEFEAGMEVLSVYTFGTGAAKHMFCSVCGVHPLNVPRAMPTCWEVNVRCVEPGTIRKLTVHRFDGEHWEASYEAAKTARERGLLLATAVETTGGDVPVTKPARRHLGLPPPVHATSASVPAGAVAAATSAAAPAAPRDIPRLPSGSGVRTAVVPSTQPRAVVPRLPLTSVAVESRVAAAGSGSGAGHVSGGVGDERSESSGVDDRLHAAEASEYSDSESDGESSAAAFARAALQRDPVPGVSLRSRPAAATSALATTPPHSVSSASSATIAAGSRSSSFVSDGSLSARAGVSSAPDFHAAMPSHRAVRSGDLPYLPAVPSATTSPALVPALQSPTQPTALVPPSMNRASGAAAVDLDAPDASSARDWGVRRSSFVR